jgi:uncharacterized protein YdiU (UPF0061 family)
MRQIVSDNVQHETIADRFLSQLGNAYLCLPEACYARHLPRPIAQAQLLYFNPALAQELKLDANLCTRDDLTQIFCGNLLPKQAEPIALAYAGHQFGYFNPRMGDGRALLIGTLQDQWGQLRDLQLKGSGPNPFSKRGDGLAALGPVLREAIVSEAMQALGLPTTRTLAAVATNQTVYREQPLPGAILTRVAHSHIRIGTFEYCAAHGGEAMLKAYLDYAITRHDPDLIGVEQPALAFLSRVIERQAKLIAHWMAIGFIHGVMNTDNMAVSGQTIDYGPCAFLDAYSHDKCFSSIDQQGRYAYGNQPQIGLWNLTRLAQALLSVIDADSDKAIEMARAALSSFQPLYERAWLQHMRLKLGLSNEQDGDGQLVADFLSALEKHKLDFTLSFRDLAAMAVTQTIPATYRPLQDWCDHWRARLNNQTQKPEESAMMMRNANPRFIPRNHRIEQAIAAAVTHNDYSLFHTLMDVLSKPYEDQPDWAAYAAPPNAEECVLMTFCGT